MTRYWFAAAAVTLACFAIVATMTSGLIAWLAPIVARRFERHAPAARARLLFRLRVLPATCAALCAFGVALPSFLPYEPLESNETLGRTLIVAAVLGGALLLRAAWRAATGLRATTVLWRNWRARGRQLDATGASIPVFAIEDTFPTVAVVGFARPELFIAERVLRECTSDEVHAMILHECAHVTHRDNLKRYVMRVCPDVLGRGGALDRAWTIASEEAADARATGGDRASALELAQALIHVARLAPGRTALQVASAFYLGGSIESRVRRLVEPADSLPDPSRPLGCVVAGAMALGLAGLIVLGAPAIHDFMETVVRVLP